MLVFQFFAITFIKVWVFHYTVSTWEQCARGQIIHQILLNTRGTASIVLLVKFYVPASPRVVFTTHGTSGFPSVVWPVRAGDFAQSNEFHQLIVHSLPEDALSSSSEASFRANVGSLYLME